MQRSLTVKWKVFLRKLITRTCIITAHFFLMCLLQSAPDLHYEMWHKQTFMFFFPFLPSLCWSSICLKTSTVSSGLRPTLLCSRSLLNSHSLYTMCDCCFPCYNGTYNGAATLSDLSLSQALQWTGLVVHTVQTRWAASLSPIWNSGILFFFIRLKVGRCWILLVKRWAWILTKDFSL